MPEGHRGERRSADAIGLAAMIGKIPSGKIEGTSDVTKGAAAKFGSFGGMTSAETFTAFKNCCALPQPRPLALRIACGR